MSTATAPAGTVPVRRPSAFFAVLATLVGLGLLALTVPSLGPTIRAARADGARGTFTAADLRCVNHGAHESCSWYGRFAPSRDPAREVYLYGSDRGMLRAGERTAAVDVGRGNRVYGPGGSHEWVFVGLLALTGLGLLLLGGRSATRLRARRREWRRERGLSDAADDAVNEVVGVAGTRS
ncbi:hypothetical protein [Streptosporangium longisporum]|uniref:LPXTG cell wall anchor domain-containing protein n=1 Tax=Streptosporangium longisporum TaxID=46187 RepID=A0ABP6KI96_9ACTN